MAGREWPLVFFTLLSQLAVGIILFVILPSFFNRPAKPPGGGRDPRLVLVLIVLGLLVAAALASLFHLGNPKNAAHALNNLKQSWLSREVLSELATLLLLTALALLVGLKVRSTVLLQATGLAAGAAGLLFLMSMARIYMLPTVKPWNTFFTPASFFLTALLLGAATAGAASFFLKAPLFAEQPMVLLSIILAAMSLILTALTAPHFGLWGYRSTAGLKLPPDPSRALFIGRMIFLLAGAILLTLQMKKASSFMAPFSRLSGLAAFCCFLAAEVSGRFLFYAYFLKER